MGRYSSALSHREAAGRAVSAVALRLAGGLLLPDRIDVHGDVSTGVAGFLAELLGQPVRFSVGIGNARANRKPVLAVSGRSGRVLAYAKLGDTEVSAALVEREAASLRRLADRRFETFAAPTLLHVGAWNGLPLLVMSALRTPAWQGRMTSRGMPAATMDELSGSFGDGRHQLVATPMWGRCLAARDALEDPSVRSRYDSALRSVASRWGDRDVAVGAWHGDFTPWNMARRRNVVQLWDWERFEIGVPTGFDRVHWSVQTRTTGQRTDPEAILAAVEAATEVDVAARAGYLATMVARYALDAQHRRGESIVSLAEAALLALERLGR